MDSYAKFMELAMKPKETGAYLRQSVFYFKEKVLFIFYIRLLEFSLHVRDGKYGTGIASEFYNVLILYCWTLQLNDMNYNVFSKVEDLPAQLEKMNELCHLPGFRHDAKLIKETGKFDKFCFLKTLNASLLCFVQICLVG